MMWIRKDIEAEQIPIQSADITAALLRLPGQTILVAAVYVPPDDSDALRQILDLLRRVIEEIHLRTGDPTRAVLVGDFNRHDQL